MSHVPNWSEIIGAGADAPSRAASALRSARWFAQVMHASEQDRDVVRVPSWSAASEFLNRGDQTSGVLKAPAALVLAVLDVEPSQQAAASGDTAARNVLAGLDYHPSIPTALTVPEVIAVTDAITGFVRFLFLEIFAAPLGSRCTYFRDQLPWFLAGYLPCGWEGEWPSGRMRIL